MIAGIKNLYKKGGIMITKYNNLHDPRFKTAPYFSVGDSVMITNGLFKDSNGTIIHIFPDDDTCDIGFRDGHQFRIARENLAPFDKVEDIKHEIRHWRFRPSISEKDRIAIEYFIDGLEYSEYLKPAQVKHLREWYGVTQPTSWGKDE
jgi:hypothetical protein